MALVYVCCFWFSLRLGSVLCAASSALKCMCFLVFILSKNVDDLEGKIDKFLRNIEYNKSITLFIVTNFNILFIIIIIFFVLYILICLIICLGALLCKPKLCYAFIVVQIIMILLGLFSYTILFKYLMCLASRAVVTGFGLGEVILFLTLGLLYLFFDIYLTICVSTFIGIIKDLQRQIQIKKHKQENNIFI